MAIAKSWTVKNVFHHGQNVTTHVQIADYHTIRYNRTGEWWEFFKRSNFNVSNALRHSSTKSSKTISGTALVKPFPVRLNFAVNLECFFNILKVTGKMNAIMFSWLALTVILLHAEKRWQFTFVLVASSKKLQKNKTQLTCNPKKLKFWGVKTINSNRDLLRRMNSNYFRWKKNSNYQTPFSNFKRLIVFYNLKFSN